MNKEEFVSIIDEFCFSKKGEIISKNGRFKFELNNSSSECGLVYLWVEISAQQTSFTVVYVGKTDKTLKARCDQHEGGLNSVRKPGLPQAELLRKGMSKNNSYEVYARKSETIDVLGESDISMACAEELAFIRKFRPPWNSDERRRKREKGSS